MMVYPAISYGEAGCAGVATSMGSLGLFKYPEGVISRVLVVFRVLQLRFFMTA